MAGFDIPPAAGSQEESNGPGRVPGTWPGTDDNTAASPYSSRQPFSSINSQSLEASAGRFLEKMRGILSRRGESQKVGRRESEKETFEIVMIKENRASGMESKESFKSFQTVREHRTIYDEGPSMMEVDGAVDTAMDTLDSSKGESNQLNRVFFDRKPTTEVLAESDLTVLVGQALPGFEEKMSLAPATMEMKDGHPSAVSASNAESRIGIFREEILPIYKNPQQSKSACSRVPIRRKTSERIRPTMDRSPSITGNKKRGRMKVAGGMRKGIPRKIKARALGRITPARGSEDSGKNNTSTGSRIDVNDLRRKLPRFLGR